MSSLPPCRSPHPILVRLVRRIFPPPGRYRRRRGAPRVSHDCQPQHVELGRGFRASPRRALAGSARSAGPRRAGGAPARSVSLLPEAERSDVEVGACVEWRQRRQARPPEPRRSVAADGGAAPRRLPSVSGKMGAPRRAVA